MNKFILFLVCVASSLSAWEDHPDREPDRSVFDSQCGVESVYDWSNRDPDSRDNDQSSSSSNGPGTILDSPDRDK